MSRFVFAVASIGLLGMLTGCTLPCAPYDYCQPTFTGEDGQSCNPRHRAGSILTGMPSEEVVEMSTGAAPTSAPTGAMSEFNIPADQILSVTDSKVGETVEEMTPMLAARPIPRKAQPRASAKQSRGRWTASKAE